MTVKILVTKISILFILANFQNSLWAKGSHDPLLRFKANFKGHKTRLVHSKSKQFFPLNSTILNRGDTQISGIVEKKSKLNSSKFDNLKKLDKIFGNIFGNKNYTHFFVSKQVFLLKDVRPSDMGVNAEIYRDDNYRKLTLDGVKVKLNPEGPHQWVTFQELPMLVGGDMVAKTYHRKIYQEDYSDNQEAVLKTSLSPGVLPQLTAVTYISSPKKGKKSNTFATTGAAHGLFKGSSSFMLFYSVGDGRDTLLINYQLATLKLNSAFSFALKKLSNRAAKIFLKDTASAIEGMRKYFAKDD